MVTSDEEMRPQLVKQLQDYFCQHTRIHLFGIHWLKTCFKEISDSEVHDRPYEVSVINQTK